MAHVDTRALLAAPVVVAALASTALFGQLPAAGQRAPVTAPAATPTPQMVTPPSLPPPALVVQIADGQPPSAMEVARVEVQATVLGFLARTTTTVTFRNPHPRQLEGELIFPLPAGATVAGYALDVAGEMVDGVVVEKQAARVAFEKEVRRRVDPGLVEWVRGNNFRTRVFPLPAKGTRTIRVTYVSDLLMEGAGETRVALYHLPLRFPGVVNEFQLRVEVDKTKTAPEVRAGSLANFRFAAWQDRFVAETRLSDAHLSEDLVVALPRVPTASTVVEEHENGERYFVVDDSPQIGPAGARPRAAARRVGLFWDASLGRRDADTTRELDVLKAWLARLGTVDVVLTAFRDAPESPRVFHVHAGDASELLAVLRKTTYDGGTGFAALRFPSDVDLSVLVSDGLGNLGEGLPPASRAPIYALNADPSADHGLLTYLAERSGGAYLNLARMTSDAAAAAIGESALATVQAEFDASQLADVLPAGKRPVRDRATFCGRLLAPEATLTLVYQRLDGSSERKAFVLKKTDAVSTGLAPRFWAERRVEELSLFPEKNHEELLDLGRRFGIVTPGASLLVLETLAQYVEHNVEPPATRPALREAYLKQVAEQNARRVTAKTDKLAQMVALWEQRVAWWQREFPRRFESKEITRRDGRRTAGHVVPGDVPDEVQQDEDLDAQGGVEGGVAGGVVGGVVGGMGAPPAPVASAPRPRMAAEPQATSGERSFTLESAAVDRRGAGSLVAPDKGKSESQTASAAATIAIKAWDPRTPYLTAMKAAGPEGPYAVYLRMRREYGTSPAFYLDCADFFLQAGQRELGIRLLTDIVELKLEDARLLRIAAHRLDQIGQYDLAIPLFEKVLRLRPEEPQSLRDLALCIAARGDARRAAKAAPKLIADDYLRAIEILNRVVEGEWDSRFSEIETVVLMEANRLIAIMEREGLPGRERIALDARLRRLLDLDVRVVLSWDTDMTDMDLWVIEPTGERCYYSNNLTRVGGAISRDFTGGYGPEEYVIKRAPTGAYAVKANYYGSQSQSLTGPTTVQATVYTRFGRPDEQRRTLTLRLTQAKDVVDIGTVRFGDAAVTR